MTTPTDTCPHCGAEEAKPLAAWMRPKNYSCGSYIRPLAEKQSDLCLEREAHNKTREQSEKRRESLVKMIHRNNKIEAQNANLQKTISSFVLVAPDDMERLKKSEAKNARLLSIAERALREWGLVRGQAWEELRAELEAIK